LALTEPSGECGSCDCCDVVLSPVLSRRLAQMRRHQIEFHSQGALVEVCGSTQSHQCALVIAEWLESSFATARRRLNRRRLTQPGLVGDKVADRAALEVAETFRDELRRVLLDGGGPPGAIDELAVDPAPQRCRSARVDQLERVCLSPRPPDNFRTM
jgi:hypothetical protein